MNRCPCGTPILDEAQWVIWGCCYACMRQKPMGLSEETLAETAAMLNDPHTVHNYTD